METARKIDAGVVNLDTGDAMYVECELTFSDVPKFDGSILMSAERYEYVSIYLPTCTVFRMVDLFQF